LFLDKKVSSIPSKREEVNGGPGIVVTKTIFLTLDAAITVGSEFFWIPFPNNIGNRGHFGRVSIMADVSHGMTVATKEIADSSATMRVTPYFRL
jgi:hypothetical protein